MASSTSSRARSTSFHRPSPSFPPARISGGATPSTPSFFDRPPAPRISLSGGGAAQKAVTGRSARRTCLCSPTTHPGSFRCSLHKGKGMGMPSAGNGGGVSGRALNARRSAMTNSLVRIGTVEGDLVKRALAVMIMPCAYQQRRREGFQPRPSRLSAMSTAAAAAADGGGL